MKHDDIVGGPLNNRRISIVPVTQTNSLKTFDELVARKHFLLIGNVRWKQILDGNQHLCTGQ